MFPTGPCQHGNVPSDHEPEGDGTDAVSAGVEQFQKAALDALHAARAMLDAAESIVKEPRAVESLLGTVGDLARTATETVAGFAAGAARAASGDDEADDEGGYETIDVG